MIIKFHNRGVGRGSGPVGYLLGRDGNREGATLDRGNPAVIEALIDSSPYAKKYTSGVLSFAEADLPRATKDKLMSDFEKALLPGLEGNQYAVLWVEHRDKGRLELNFVVPNIELQSGKRLQPYFHKADNPRLDAWRTVVNGELKLHDPDDPLNRQAVITPKDLPRAHKEAAQAITDGLLRMAGAGEIQSRDDVRKALQGAGFSVVRETKNSLSIADPDGGRNIRLKGVLYEQDFRHGEGLRAELEAAGQRYREASERRVHEARESYLRGVEIKRGENERRYCRAQPEHGLAVAQNVDLDAGQHRPVLERNERDPLVSGGIDSGAASQSPSLGGEGRQDKAGPVREEVGAPLRADLRFQPGRLGEGYVLGGSEGVLNDGIGAGIVLRVRGFAERIRAAAQGMAGKLRELGEHVREHQARGREQPGSGETLDVASGRLNAASGRLEQAAGGLDRASQQVAKEREHRLLKVLDRGWERGDRSRGFER
ncbi:relaxase/mobilization nuclease domain-containing protein [Aeromonas caviae]|uniref:Relaxase/mobilization nuclease domain-containing protein n=1 Tax=Aeromonas caviae TaxID=648 RepID=A0AA43AKX5_AERCA|nr:relaxase/mobilization nuclease domain-containing protein [Aeromonas caviae]MDH1900693.1 relaxase/mobilization nuclease domain-containing protein [Aeromonas caviae]